MARPRAPKTDRIQAWMVPLALLLLATPVSALSLVGGTQDAAPAPDAPPEDYTPPSISRSQDAHKQLAIECPATDPSVVFQPDADTVIERTQCPFRIIDGADLLGSPVLVADPDDARRLAFVSLHGCATDQGPNPWSRSSNGCPQSSSAQTHTTFTTIDEGRLWKDQPHGNSGFGEMAHAVVDRDGRMYLVHLFSSRIGSEGGQAVFDYHFNLYKPQQWQDINYYSREIQNREPGNKIEHVELVLVTPWTRVDSLERYNQTTQNGTAPSTDGDLGNRTIPAAAEDTSNDTVVAVWHERAFDYETSTTGKSSWVDAVYTDTTSRNEWHHIPDSQLIGPCREASNAEAWNGRVYVACSVDAGYNGRRGARIGDVDLWAWEFDGDEVRKQYVSTASVRDGELKLDINDQGMMAITSVKPVGDEAPYGAVQVDVTFGWYGRQWLGALNGGALHQLWGGEFREARITAMELLDGDRPTLYISYLERLTGTANTDIDPNNPLQPQSAVEYRKSVSSWEPCGEGMMAILDLNVGIVRSPFEQGVVNGFTGAFDDYQDGMVSTRNTFGEPAVYFAYGDHGVIQYGSIAGDSGSGECIIPPPPILFPPPALAPIALTSGSATGIGLAAALGAPATVMFGYLLVAKRRAALAAVTKAK